MSEFLSDGVFGKFRDLIYNSSGIHFSESNRTILESRLKERLKKSGLDSVEAYFDQINSDTEELKGLLDSVTTNLTRFFRNTSHFETFENYVIPDLVKRKQAKGDYKFRLWSAGCSTGEEPYSLAMVLKDKLPSNFTIDITASDLSLKSLMTAKEGFYKEARINGIPDDYLKRFTTQKADGYVINDEIKKMIKFDYHNLKYDSGLTNLDIIFCRNVLIYFDEPAQEAVVNRFYQALDSHSYLFIGHSEPLFGMNTKFQFLKTDWACIYSKILD
ncbi:CheR family methyltransferase [Spirochaeta cellobiosiphila]|uniref:CheR family methyltransferase n=1 Tax=Spirochaeta cellobiosiphila TaxID=504483 RepID=UPI0003FC610B|nr:protein-glutamate O-methyltransferase CheR [Spirochaeta cellobiosiphila]